MVGFDDATLVRRAQNGDKDAGEKILAKYDNLCRKAASRNCYGLTRDEKLAVARLHLWKAVTTYDVSKGHKFITWAYTCVMQGMYTEQRDILIQLGHNRLKQQRKEMYLPPVPLHLLERVVGDDAQHIAEDLAAEEFAKKLMGKLKGRSRQVAQQIIADPTAKAHEVGEALGLTSSHVYVIRHGIRKAAQELLSCAR